MSVITPGRNIVLIGMMGTGKTCVGRVLAGRLARQFSDTDAVVEREAGRSVREIFADEGERGFRAHEALAVRQVAALRGQVIAVGGGAVLDPGNVTQLRMTGDLVLLSADPEELAQRLGRARADRPLVDTGEDLVDRLRRLLVDRSAAYSAAASVTVPTGGRAPAAIAEEILRWAATRPGLLARDELEAIS